MNCSLGIFAYFFHFLSILLFIALFLIGINLYHRGYQTKLIRNVIICFSIVLSISCFNTIVSSQKLIANIEPTFCTQIKIGTKLSK